MALLAGSTLAVHTLQLTEGSQQLLPDIFPGVGHIKYFNLRTQDANELLQDTGHHLGAVAVPYALAVHEDFIMTVLDLLVGLGYARQADGNNSNKSKNMPKAWNMHEAVYLTLGITPPSSGPVADRLQQFHLLRHMRNAQIHNGGEVSSDLIDAVNAMSAKACTEWARIGRRQPSDITSTPEVHFTVFDIFAVFAVTKALGRQVNDVLANEVGIARWADICIADYASISSQRPNSDQWMRAAIGHALLLYSATGITPEDVIDGAVRAGHWQGGRFLVPRRVRRQRNPGAGPPPQADGSE